VRIVGDYNKVSVAADHARDTRRLSAGLLGALLLAALMAVLQALPESAEISLRYTRTAVGNGEVWRLLTASIIHLGWAHLALNAAALLIMGWMFGDECGAGIWLGAFVVSALASAGGLYVFRPDIEWVVGLSGALHGLFVFGAAVWVFERHPPGKWLLAGVAAKVAWEQFTGEIPLSADIVGGPVIVDAHLWGATGGALAAAALWILRWRRGGRRL